MSISADHGQQKDGPRSGWPVLPGQQSSSTETPHGQQSPWSVCCDDLDALARQLLFDYRPQGGSECDGLSLPTFEELFRRRLLNLDQLINCKSEQQHTAFASAVPHMEGAISTNAAASQLAEFEVRSNSWCNKVPCHETSKKEFDGDWVIECRSSQYSEKGHQSDTKQSRNSTWEKWHTTANTIQQERSPTRTPAAEQAVADSKAADQHNCASNGECIVGNCRKSASVSERQSRFLGFHRFCIAEVKLTNKERPCQERDQDSEWHLGLETVDNNITVLPKPNSLDAPKLTTREALQSNCGCLVIINVIVSRTVDSSKSTWPSAAADLLLWFHRLYGRQQYTTSSSRQATVTAGSTESSDIVQCTQPKNLTSSPPTTPMFFSESGSSSDISPVDHQPYRSHQG